MEDDQNGRRPKWKTTKMEDDQNGRRPKWKTNKTGVNWSCYSNAGKLVSRKVSGFFKSNLKNSYVNGLGVTPK